MKRYLTCSLFGEATANEAPVGASSGSIRSFVEKGATGRRRRRR
jgi:hypothetical protein